jgi:DNA-binding cell septation regulator SpoVG
MEITDVKVFLKEGQDKKLKAYATLTFDNCFVVRNVKVIEGNKGMFVAMPSRKVKDPNFVTSAVRHYPRSSLSLRFRPQTIPPDSLSIRI